MMSFETSQLSLQHFGDFVLTQMKFEVEGVEWILLPTSDVNR